MEARGLYEALERYQGAEPYPEVVAPWLDRTGDGYRARLATAAVDGPWWSDVEAGRWLRRELYALQRVSDLLLLPLQPPSGQPGESDPPLLLSRVEYLDLFARLGMEPRDGCGAFDPFLHEIVEVEQAEAPDAPIEVTEVLWPGLMLGQLLFGRAGVRVRAGAARAQRGVADRSPLYWTFRRRHRPAVDLSHGWGHNSQWRTDFRLDYRTPDGDRLNVAEAAPIDGRDDLPLDHPANLGAEERLLTPGERRELLRHRCLLRTPEAAGALARSAGWDVDLMPFDWRLPQG